MTTYFIISKFIASIIGYVVIIRLTLRATAIFLETVDFWLEGKSSEIPDPRHADLKSSFMAARCSLAIHRLRRERIRIWKLGRRTCRLLRIDRLSPANKPLDPQRQRSADGDHSGEDAHYVVERCPIHGIYAADTVTRPQGKKEPMKTDPPLFLLQPDMASAETLSARIAGTLDLQRRRPYRFSISRQN